MLGGMAYQDSHNTSIVSADINDISAIKGSIRKTAIDVFVYNTADDSDGGAWRKRCVNTSWYNMELGTRHRGHRREFPSVAVIVMEAGGATPGTEIDYVIYDGDDPSFPMWMTSRFCIAASASYDNNGDIVAKNGWIVHGRENNGLAIFDFIKDKVTVHNHVHRHTYHKIARAITGYNVKGEFAQASATGYAITAEHILGLDIGVPAGSKVDPISKMPIPSIFVGCSGSGGGNHGWALIRSDGSVSTQTESAGSDGNGRYGANAKFILNDMVIFAGKNTYGSSDRHSNAYEIVTRHHGFPKTHHNAYIDFVDNGSDGNRSNQINWYGNFAGERQATAIDENEFAVNMSSTGDSVLKYWIKKNDIRGSMVSVIKDSYCTGWMPGEVRNVFLTDTDDSSAITGTDGGVDRGQSSNHLDVTGSITRTKVATGADLVSFGGWSSSNNLRGTIGTGPGQGDFFVQAWVKSPDSQPSGSYFHMFSLGSSSTGGQTSGSGFVLKCLASSAGIQWYPYSGDNANQGIDHSKCIQKYGTWAHVTIGRDGGVWKCYMNGILRDTGNSDNDNKDDTYLTLGIGLGATASEHFNPAPQVALLRYNTYAHPNAEMIAKIYRDELPLFEEDAKCTLYGTSSLVKGMDYDKTTGILHAGTSAGRSDFRGFSRINNTTTAVGTAISAAAGIIAEQ